MTMRYDHLAAAACLLLASPCIAQPRSSEVTKTLVCDRGSDCSYGYINGQKYETMANGKVSVLVVIGEIGKYVRTDIFVLNESSGVVDVLPTNFILTELAPKQKPLKYVDGDKLINTYERRLALANAMTEVGANQQQRSTTTSTGTISSIGSDGTNAVGTFNSRSTTSAPNLAAQAQAAETIRARNEAFASTADFASRTILRANTLQPNGRIRGYLFFDRDKKEKSIMLSGIVGNTIYQFPFDLTVQ